MITYLFWHTRREDTDRSEYEHSLVRFHAALIAHPPQGFIRSLAFHLSGAPWLPGGGEGYEDWYLLESTAGLDVLNEAAVGEALADSHADAAQRAAWGTAGLYQPFCLPQRQDRREPADLPTALDGIEAASALWFSKPVGMSYSSMLAKLKGIETQIESRVWQRMMTLGPAPELCLLGRGVDALPHGWEGQLVVRRKVWSNPKS